MANLRIYDNPKIRALRAGQYPPLGLSGSLMDYVSEVAYEDRLTISNEQGDCSVQILSSTNLPNGATITVDNATDEVVIAWPAYQILSLEGSLVNPGFEDGDTDWVKGLGWEIGVQAVNQVYSGTQSAQYIEGHRGNSRLVSAHRRECVPGTVITASCQIQQGASSEGNAGGWIMVFFYDVNGVQLQEKKGNKVDEGSNSEWNQSTVTDTAPAGTAYALIGAEAFRKKQNRSLWFDAFAWNLAPAVDEYVGTNDTLDVTLSLRITDAAGRTADWTGTIFADEFVLEFEDFTINAQTQGGTAASGHVLSGYSPTDRVKLLMPSGLTYQAWSQYSGDGGHPLPWQCTFHVTNNEGVETTYLPTAYADATAARAAAEAYLADNPIVLTGSTSYSVWVADSPINDNRGGLSFRVLLDNT